jgi:hypothetical protein
MTMSKLILATSVALLTLGSAASAATPEICGALWKKADTKAEGKIGGDIAKPFLAAMEALKIPAAMAKDGVLEGKEFMDACQKDAFKDMM